MWENITHFGPSHVYSVWDRLVNLKPKLTTHHSSKAPPTSLVGGGTCMKGRRREVLTFTPCHLAASQIHCAPHPPAAHLAPCPTHCLLVLSRQCIFVVSTAYVKVYFSPFLPLSPSIPQLWFRHQGCSITLPVLDHVTLPLLSCSPSKSGIVELACLPAYLDLWACAVQPQTPLVSGAAPAMAQALWKIMQMSEQREASSAVVLRLHFLFLFRGWPDLLPAFIWL